MVDMGARDLDFCQILQFHFSVSTHYTYVVSLPPTLYNLKKLVAQLYKTLLSFCLSTPPAPNF